MIRCRVTVSNLDGQKHDVFCNQQLHMAYYDEDEGHDDHDDPIRNCFWWGDHTFTIREETKDKHLKRIHYPRHAVIVEVEEYTIEEEE